MAKHKNDYSAIVFFENDSRPKKWAYVHTLNSFALFLNKSHSNWEYMNIYERRSGNYLRRFKRGDFIPAFLDI